MAEFLFVGVQALSITIVGDPVRSASIVLNDTPKMVYRSTEIEEAVGAGTAAK